MHSHALNFSKILLLVVITEKCLLNILSKIILFRLKRLLCLHIQVQNGAINFSLSVI